MPKEDREDDADPGCFMALPQRVHRSVSALLDKIEIWDTSVSHRSRSRLLASPIALQIFRELHLAVSVEGV